MFSEVGIIVNNNGKRISLDPKSHNNCDFTFVSHAHTDHLYKRALMKPAFIPSVHTLIIESTFGRAEYVFPQLEEIIHKTNKVISDMYDLGVPVILMGYPLGKAQLLTALFGHWEPMFVYDSIQ